MSYIPSELIPNIIARLPAEDVLRCTSVCKSWYSLITSPFFATSHLELSSPNQEPRLLVKINKNANSSTDCYVHRYSETFDEVADLDPPFKGYIIDSLNGLVCLLDAADDQDTIVLWNPSLKKYFILPEPKVLSNPLEHTIDYGFGFIASSNEYKVLRLSLEYDEDKFQVEIFQLSTGTWRELEVEDYSYFKNDSNSKAHLNGVVHWYKSYSNFISYFNMKLEKFGTLMVPSCLSRLSHVRAYCRHSTYRESLCLMECSDFFTIWEMMEYGVAGSWEKLYIIDTKHLKLAFCQFRDNRELLFQSDDKEIGGNGTELVSYDCNNKQVKNLGVFSVDLPSVYTYMDSLALIKTPNKV